MAIMNVFKTTTTLNAPLDGSAGSEAKPGVSDFLTVQSLTNFAAMTGAITAAWHALQTLNPHASALWIPYVFAFVWGLISLLISIEGLKKSKDGETRLEAGTLAGAIFIAVINSLVLASAVVGANVGAKQTP
jgi:hypothetical protein